MDRTTYNFPHGIYYVRVETVRAFYLFYRWQAIAKKICGQVTKTTNTIKKLVKEYGKKITENQQSRYPANITFEEITDLNSTIWNYLEEELDAESPVPYYIRRKIVDFHHIIHRCTEEFQLIKEEMARVIDYYRLKVSALLKWSEELRKEDSNPESRGLLTMVLTKKELLDVVSQHLNVLFAPYMVEDVILPEEVGVFTTSIENEDEEELPSHDDLDGEDDVSDEAEEEDTLDIFVSLLNEEFGSDNEDSDVEHSDDKTN